MPAETEWLTFLASHPELKLTFTDDELLEALHLGVAEHHFIRMRPEGFFSAYRRDASNGTLGDRDRGVLSSSVASALIYGPTTGAEERWTPIGIGLYLPPRPVDRGEVGRVSRGLARLARQGLVRNVARGWEQARWLPAVDIADVAEIRLDTVMACGEVGSDLGEVDDD